MGQIWGQIGESVTLLNRHYLPSWAVLIRSGYGLDKLFRPRLEDFGRIWKILEDFYNWPLWRAYFIWDLVK
jgi:hypothetical protein